MALWRLGKNWAGVHNGDTTTVMFGRQSCKVWCIRLLMLGISCECGAQHFEDRRGKDFHRAICKRAATCKATRDDNAGNDGSTLGLYNSHSSRLVFQTPC